MNDIVINKISYKQLFENNWLTDIDKYGLAAFVNDNVRHIFLNCPNNNVDEKSAILLAIDNGIVVGRLLLYGTK